MGQSQNPWRSQLEERPHHGLKVWHLGKELALQIYRITENFPTDERFELRSQLRRAAVGIPSHIAEGSARNTDPDFARFLYMARGALEEIDTQLEFAGERGYLRSVQLQDVADTFENLSRALDGLLKSLKK